MTKPRGISFNGSRSMRPTSPWREMAEKFMSTPNAFTFQHVDGGVTGTIDFNLRSSDRDTGIVVRFNGDALAPPAHDCHV